MDRPKSLQANTCYLACHVMLLACQVVLGVRYKTWGFLFGMFCGHMLEMLGYIARIQMYHGEDRFIMNIVTLTIGPAFFSAAIYLCLARIVVVFGEHVSRFLPRTYTVVFMVADLIALVLQAAGGGILGEKDPGTWEAGVSVIKAGLVMHLVSIALFVVLAAEFALSVCRARGHLNNRFQDMYLLPRFTTFLIGLSVATLCILIRTTFRMIELSEGPHSKIARNEIAFIILEGAMVLSAAAILTAWHPGAAFHGRWEEADFQMRGGSRYELERVQRPVVPIDTADDANKAVV